MKSIEFGPIEPSKSNAKELQWLTLSTAQSENITHPMLVADPYNPFLLVRQLRDLRENPDNYTGAYVDGSLEGYLKTDNWTNEDNEQYFAGQSPVVSAEYAGSGVMLDIKKKLGIFGLAVSHNLDNETAFEILDTLVERAVNTAYMTNKSAVNISVSEIGLLQPTVIDHGFEFTGHIHEQRRREGLMHRLYYKPLDY